jgi:hypothetical protein
MRYANGDDYLHPHQATPLYAELPSELIDRTPGTDTALLQKNLRACGQSRALAHPLQNFV